MSAAERIPAGDDRYLDGYADGHYAGEARGYRRGREAGRWELWPLLVAMVVMTVVVCLFGAWVLAR